MITMKEQLLQSICVSTHQWNHHLFICFKSYIVYSQWRVCIKQNLSRSFAC